MALLESASLVAFAFTAGMFTFFAPCSYPLLPGYLSYYIGERPAGSAVTAANGGTAAEGGWVTRHLAVGVGAVVPDPHAPRLARALTVSLLVSAGFFVVYAVLAGIVVAVGAHVLAGISVLELVVGGLLVLIGGAMAVGWTPRFPSVMLPERRRSAGGYFGFGILYAAAAAGCTAPLFIGVALKALSVGAGLSLLTFAAYAAGMSVLMMAVTLAAALGRGALLKRFTRRIDLIHRAAGVLLVLAGLFEIYFFLFRFEGLALLGL